MRRLAALLLPLLLLSAPLLAAEPGEMLADPVLEARARALGHELRCLVCQNQSIEESNADLARDLRLLVRERIAAGDSDAEVKDWLRARYGDFVLLRPPVKPATWPLWFGPPLLAFLALLGIVAWYRRRSRAAAAPPPLSGEERARLDRVLNGGGGT